MLVPGQQGVQKKPCLWKILKKQKQKSERKKTNLNLDLKFQANQSNVELEGQGFNWDQPKLNETLSLRNFKVSGQH